MRYSTSCVGGQLSLPSLERQRVVPPHPSLERVGEKTAAVRTAASDSLRTLAPPAPAQQPRRHTVNLQSEPDGASVIINGKPAGRTPLSVNLERGSYTIVFEKRSHSTAHFEINLKDRSTSHLFITYSSTLIAPEAPPNCP